LTTPLIRLTPLPQTSPTSLTSYCSKYAFFDTTYSTTVCAGMDYNQGNDLGYKAYTGTFAAALASCQSWCFSTYSSAMGGFVLGSEASTSQTCVCKGTQTSSKTTSCWYGVGFYKGERPWHAGLAVAVVRHAEGRDGVGRLHRQQPVLVPDHQLQLPDLRPHPVPDRVPHTDADAVPHHEANGGWAHLPRSHNRRLLQVSGLTGPFPAHQIAPTTTWSYCSRYQFYDSTYSTTVCAGWNYNQGSDLGSKTFTGTFAAALTSCQAWCFSTYSSAMGGFVTGSEASTSQTCTCKGAVTTNIALSCWVGAGFYRGEWPVILA
jgi:hypothetical protein